MEPIKISNLPEQAIDLIVKNPDRFNNHIRDEYIDKEEIGELLTGLIELGDEGLDTFKAVSNMVGSKPATNKTEETKEVEKEPVAEEAVKAEEVAEEPATTESEETAPEEETSEKSADTTEEDDEIKEIIGEDDNPVTKKVLNMLKRDTARIELESIDASDVALNSPGNPLNTIYKTAQGNQKDFIEYVSGDIQKVDMELKESSMTEENVYHHTNSKGEEKDWIVQYSITTEGTASKEKVLAPSGDNTEGSGSTDPAQQTETAPKTTNNLDGGVHLSAVVKTDNFKGALDANIDNTEQNIFTAVEYNKDTVNGGKLGLTGTARVKIDQNLFTGCGGFAVDYVKGKLFTGALGHFNYQSTDSGNLFDYDAQAFVNYDGIGGLEAGVFGLSTGITRPYIKGNLYGNKSYDNGLNLDGSVSAEVSHVFVKKDLINDVVSNTDAKVTFRGSLKYKAGDKFSANADVLAVYYGSFASGMSPVHELGGILKTRLVYGKTELYSTGCLYKDLSNNDPLVKAVATLGVQRNDIGKKGVAAYIEGVVCNTKDNTNPDSSISGIKVGTRLCF